MSQQITIGVDIGGTHITAALVDTKESKLITSSILRAHLDTHLSEEEIYAQWAKVIVPHLAHSQTIGIAMPGPFDYEQGIALMNGQDKYDQIYKKNIKIGFANFLQIPSENILFMNDAACFLKGEMMSGAGKNFSNAIGITLGTGLGSTAYDGKTAIDADMWNIPYQNGIAEEYISSRWFTNRYKAITGNEIANVKAIVDLGDHHPIVNQLFAEFSEHLAFFIHAVHQKHGGEAVVIGGSINKAHRLFLKSTQECLKNQYQLKIPLVIATLSEDAALVGAASLWAHKI